MLTTLILLPVLMRPASGAVVPRQSLWDDGSLAHNTIDARVESQLEARNKPPAGFVADDEDDCEDVEDEPTGEQGGQPAVDLGAVGSGGDGIVRLSNNNKPEDHPDRPAPSSQQPATTDARTTSNAPAPTSSRGSGGKTPASRL